MFKLVTFLVLFASCQLASSDPLENDLDKLTLEQLDVVGISSLRHETSKLPESERCKRVWSYLDNIIHPREAPTMLVSTEQRTPEGPMDARLLRKVAELLSARKGSGQTLSNFINYCAYKLDELSPPVDQLPASNDLDSTTSSDGDLEEPAEMRELRAENEALKRQVTELKAELYKEQIQITTSLLDCEARLINQTGQLNETEEKLRMATTKMEECEARQLDQGGATVTKIKETLEKEPESDIVRRLQECEEKYQEASSRAATAGECEAKLKMAKEELNRALARANVLVTHIRAGKSN